jgi:hypothetical protein
MSEVKCTMCVLCGKLFTTPVIQQSNYYYYHCYCPDCEKEYMEAIK